MSLIIGSGHRKSTSRTYNSAQKSYLQFCNLFSLIPIPASEQTLLRYIAHISPSVGPQSIHVYLAAIRTMHITQGFDSPPTNTPRISLAIKGLLSSAPPPKQKTPLTFDILNSIHSILPSDFDSLATWACMTFTFFACLRAGEITPSLPLEPGQSPPLVSHLSFGTTNHGQNFAQLIIPRTKTSPHGITAIVGCTGKPVCAWCAMVQYLNCRHISNPKHVHTPLFILSNNSFIHKQYLVNRTRSFIATIGLNPDIFTGHSFRVGAATQASMNLMPEFHIQQLGHWKSNAYKTYIHTPIHQIVNYSNILANSENKFIP